ncbi:MAG: hypothetical protein COW05_00820 [Gammaproteobacteria bacterium CG12_big_fil_rev_8_21_14_0_65_46_12]|nr:MAG: hypothetical protein COW05_00820 [Gammaproteobacteria bacterium CG12_big_fil_rev_8_21_14_0_65_46_12]
MPYDGPQEESFSPPPFDDRPEPLALTTRSERAQHLEDRLDELGVNTIADETPSDNNTDLSEADRKTLSQLSRAHKTREHAQYIKPQRTQAPCDNKVDESFKMQDLIPPTAKIKDPRLLRHILDYPTPPPPNLKDEAEHFMQQYDGSEQFKHESLHQHPVTPQPHDDQVDQDWSRFEMRSDCTTTDGSEPLSDTPRTSISSSSLVPEQTVSSYAQISERMRALEALRARQSRLGPISPRTPTAEKPDLLNAITELTEADKKAIDSLKKNRANIQAEMLEADNSRSASTTCAPGNKYLADRITTLLARAAALKKQPFTTPTAEQNTNSSPQANR